jgi:hypothetical protein
MTASNLFSIATSHLLGQPGDRPCSISDRNGLKPSGAHEWVTCRGPHCPTSCAMLARPLRKAKPSAQRRLRVGAQFLVKDAIIGQIEILLWEAPKIGLWSRGARL